MTGSLSPLTRHQLHNLFGKLTPALTKPYQEAAGKLLHVLDEQGRATSEQLHQALFPLAETRSASAQLTKLLKHLAETAGRNKLVLDYRFTGAKSKGAAQRTLEFLGPAVTLRADLEGLRAIPPAQVIAGQHATVWGEPCVLVVTFNEHEHAAVAAAFRPGGDPPTRHEGDCIADDLGVHGGMRVLCVFSQQGSAEAQGAVARAWQAFRPLYQPLYVIACGIAFGVDPQKQAIGDVLVSDALIPYELARMTRGEETLRDARPPASARLVEWVRNLDQRRKHGSHGSSWPAVRIGKILSGDKLLDDQNFRDRLIALAGTDGVIGGEMEGSGLYHALKRDNGHWIVIKGICDWGDGHKNNPNKERDQQRAAANAAEVVKSLLDTGWLPPREELAEGKLQRTAPSAREGPDEGAPCAGEGMFRSMQLDVLQKQPHFALHQRAREAELNRFVASAEGKTDPGRAGAPDDVVALDYLLEWARNPDDKELCALLGETGMGKTTTVQRLVEQLQRERAEGKDVPEALYFDLRKMEVAVLQAQPTSRDGALQPVSERTMADCIRNGWLNVDGQLPSVQAVLSVIDKGALVVYDGLDEVLARIGEREGLGFTQGLLRTLEESRARRGAATPARLPKLLVTCRTQFFRTLAEQDSHLTGERRGANTPKAFKALVLKELSEEQIRTYLAAVCPGEEMDALMERIESIHNLRELAARPFTLTLVAEFLPRIDQWRAQGRRITGAVLYREVAREWLIRDKQKQTLRLEDKERIAAELAVWFWQKGVRGVSAVELEDWLDDWIGGQGVHSRYATLSRDLLDEDLRNSTFLKRMDGEDRAKSRFEFAHTSLFEFFLALALLEALRSDARERWALQVPSDETLVFLGQLLEAENDRGALLQRLGAWRLGYLPRASELQLAYCIQAWRNRLPLPPTEGFDLAGADLSDWRVGEEHEPTSFSGAPLFSLRGAKFAGAVLRRCRFWCVDLRQADLVKAELVQAEFLECALDPEQNAAAAKWACAVRLEGGAVQPLASPWRHGTRRQLVNTRHVGEVSTAKFTTDGQLLLSGGGEDGTLRLWNTRNGEPLWVVHAHEAGVRSCAISADGSRVLSGGRDGTLRMWDARSGERLMELRGHEGSLEDCVFSPDGQHLLSVDADGTLRRWRTDSGKVLRVLSGQNSPVNCAAISLDGRQWLLGNPDGTLELLDAESGETLLILKGHESELVSCAFSPDGQSLLSGDEDGILHLWDIKSAAVLRTLHGHIRAVTACTFSPDGRELLSGSKNGSVRVWDAITGDLVHVLTAVQVSCCAFSSDRRFVCGEWGGAIRLWSADDGEVLLMLSNHGDRVLTCAFSPAGGQILSGGSDGTLRLWNSFNGELLATPAVDQFWVTSCAFSPDGKKLLSAGIDGTLRLWTAESCDELLMLNEDGQDMESCAFSPDGSLLLGGAIDGTLRMWSAANGELLLVLRAHDSEVTSCAFSPDGSRLLSAGETEIRLWDSKSGKALLELKVPEDHWVEFCTFASNGRRLLSGLTDGTLRLWDADSGEELRVLHGHSDWVRSCAFSPDGRRLLSGSDDGVLRVWDAFSGEILQVVHAQDGWVCSCTFSPDGQQLLSAGTNGTLSLWDANTGELLRSHLHASLASAAWTPDGELLYATGRAWRYLRYQFKDESGALRQSPIEECAPWV